MNPSSHLLIGPLNDAATKPLEVEVRWASDDPDPLRILIEFEPDEYGGAHLNITIKDNERGDAGDIEITYGPGEEDAASATEPAASPGPDYKAECDGLRETLRKVAEGYDAFYASKNRLEGLGELLNREHIVRAAGF